MGSTPGARKAGLGAEPLPTLHGLREGCGWRGRARPPTQPHRACTSPGCTLQGGGRQNRLRYLQQEDELREPLDGLRHQAVQCDAVRAGLLTLLRGQGPSPRLRPRRPPTHPPAGRSPGEERTPPAAPTRDLHGFPQPLPAGWGAPRGQRRGRPRSPSSTVGLIFRGSAPCLPWRPRGPPTRSQSLTLRSPAAGSRPLGLGSGVHSLPRPIWLHPSKDVQTKLVFKKLLYH